MTASEGHDQCCDQMAYAVADEDLYLLYIPKSREWGIRYRDGISYSQIEYCPWCGAKLPKDLWDEWYARVEQLGIDPIEDHDKIPEAFRGDRWWKEAGL
ncbi:hypothetical protein TH66_17675 [Carbonactinospora thermoautotrophica]|uniref:DUF6980 domain-containing protein n=1 Tax=Carbonactinospora thermoautotrophica TaxID=1469144 RepID=A0A132MLK4_9ACTN|nr:hypothetical protein [Carbonactinospora thermoautotrophica]KWW97468.1 hypothetical protein TH66_17675 [Carbonactinospora thermoautotrophica]KWW98744.1 hypothetical protein LI90_373 [Carbonactinospora thermoautotrophica]KWX10409.1 hypothetical protein TR74_03795 [Carbonactinospora thermoautotrophica]